MMDNVLSLVEFVDDEASGFFGAISGNSNTSGNCGSSGSWNC